MLYLQYFNHPVNQVRLNTNISERKFIIYNRQKEFYKMARIVLNHRLAIVTNTMSPTLTKKSFACDIQCVPLATEPGISLIILPLIRILQRNLKRSYLIV